MDDGDSELELEELSYEAKESLLSGAESDFFGVLSRVVGDVYHVWPMVRLADLVDIRAVGARHRSLLNRVTQYHVDFVLCDRGTFRPVLAIELDDRTHDRPKRVKRDATFEVTLAAAGIPLARFRVRPKFDPDRVLRKLRQAMKSGVELRTEELPRYRGRVPEDFE